MTLRICPLCRKPSGIIDLIGNNNWKCCYKNIINEYYKWVIWNIDYYLYMWNLIPINWINDKFRFDIFE